MTKKNIQEGAEFLAAVLENTNEGIVACDAQGHLSYFNKKAREMHGLDNDDIPPEEWAEHYDLYRPDGKTLLSKNEIPLYRTLKGETIKEVEFVIAPKGKKPILLQCNGQPLFDKNHVQTGAMVTFKDITEAREVSLENVRQLEQLNLELTKSEARFRTIFEQAPFSIQILNPDGKTVLVNPAWKKIFNVSEDLFENFIMKDYNVLTDPLLEAKGVLPLIKRGFKGEIAVIPEIFYDPTQIGIQVKGAWIESTIYPLKDNEGRLREVAIIHNDVTSKHHSQEEREMLLAELAFERNRLNAIVQQMPMGLLVAEAPDARFSIRNDLAETMLGDLFPVNNVQDYANYRGIRPDGTEYLPEEWPLVRSLFKGEIIRDEHVEMVYSNGKSSILSLSSAPIRDDDGHIMASVIIGTDITEKIQIERSQKIIADVTSTLLRTLDYNKVIEKIAITTIPDLADGCIIDLVYGMDIVERIVARHRKPETEALMRELQQRFPPHVKSKQPSIMAILTGKPQLHVILDQEIIKARAENEEHRAIVTSIDMHSYIAVPIFVKEKVIGALNIFRSSDRHTFNELDLATAQEVSRRAALAIENARLYQDAKTAIKQRDDFISIASHELKTPITALKLQMDVVARSVGKKGIDQMDLVYLQKFADKSIRQLDRLTRLVEDMLDISRIETGKLTLNLKQINLSELVHDVLIGFKETINENEIKLTTHIDLDINLTCDPYRIEQVITNFMTNALRYGEKSPITVYLSKKKEKIVLKVQDKGPGIAPHDHERIFQRFERISPSREVSGLGLGLYISQQIAQQHGGKIYVESEVGHGATFYLELTPT